jgi:hypothetical protein
MKKGGKTEDENRIWQDQTKTNKNRIHTEVSFMLSELQGGREA